jgi:hypothetical protein
MVVSVEVRREKARDNDWNEISVLIDEVVTYI